MKKNLILLLLVILLLSCQKEEASVRENEIRPLQLTEAEVDLWKQLMIVNHKKSGVYRAARAALNADKVIIELRQRRTEQK
jgi:hypothetical protein